MPSSIPASAIVGIQPSVISAGGSGLDLVGLILTTNAQLPVGVTQSFPSLASVSAYFGPLSTEATLAGVYFNSYVNSYIKPGSLLFSRYVETAVAAYLRGGSVASMALTALQALTGVLTISVGGVAQTSATINLSAATSFSNAATIIQSGFTAPGFTVTWDSLSGGFVFTNTATGASSTISVATGSLSSALNLTAATGAVTSQGAIQYVPAVAMAAVVAQTQNWVTFTTAFVPANGTAEQLAFAAWANTTNNRFAYLAWDAGTAETATPDTTSLGALVAANNYSGTVPIYDPNNGAQGAALAMGYAASLQFTRKNGRAVAAFRNGTLLPGVTNLSIAQNLQANGYNFVGSYATANSTFTFFYPGQISGAFKWFDTWLCQVWMNNSFQFAFMTLLTTVGQIPYNVDGYALMEAAAMDTINAAVNFGAIRAGVALSALEIAEVNNAAGLVITDTLQQKGWYLQILDPGAPARAARTSPNSTFWYTDGASVQQISLASVSVQ